MPNRYDKNDKKLAAEATAYSMKYHPSVKAKMIEPDEEITIAVVEHRTVEADGRPHHLVYRRDTNFSGNLSEALKLFEWP